jgi:hypothetical protein
MNASYTDPRGYPRGSVLLDRAALMLPMGEASGIAESMRRHEDASHG